jgi:hypothetical protein
MDTFNEGTILILTYLAWTFSDYQDDPDMSFKVGWAYCGVIILNILLNLATILYISAYLPVLRYCRGDHIRK